MEAKIKLGERQLPYLWKKSARRRTISVTLHPERGLVVHTPKRYPKHGVEDFLQKKSDWILRHLGSMEAQQARRRKVSWEQGAPLPLLGRSYPLRITTGAAMERVGLEEECIAVALAGSAPPGQRGEEVRALVVEWYMEQAYRMLGARVELFGRPWGLNPARLRVRAQRRRWGSCSAKGSLNFNWRLILAPLPVLDYVVVHELSHLRHLNHSPAFWELVASLLPGYQEHRLWLRENGSRLEL